MQIKQTKQYARSASYSIYANVQHNNVCSSVQQVIQHRKRVYVQLCSSVNELLDEGADLAALLQPVLAALGIVATQCDHEVYGTKHGGCFVVLQ